MTTANETPTVDGDGVVKPTILMLQGLPASGKTTHARQLVEQGNWIRVNKDDLRLMMNNGKYSKQNEKRVIRIRDQIIIDALALGNSVIVDDTNFAPHHLNSMMNLAQKMDARLHVRFIDTPLEDCLARNANRDNPVPEKVIMDMYNQYLAPKEEESKDEPEEELEECIIVDMDGTLAHMDGRISRHGEKVAAYRDDDAHDDTLDDAVANIVGMAYQNGYKVIVFTGRKAKSLPVAKKWLKDNGVQYDEIHARMDNDKRADTIVKKEMYQAFVEGKYKVKYIIDDRPSVCRMWRELGLKVMQVGDPHKEF